ncbi:MAG: hypothetical protein CMB43_01795 [Euryarchaeota archaeon]|nr:hypothetical protein [Euryarchaeota archaeon]
MNRHFYRNKVFYYLKKPEKVNLERFNIPIVEPHNMARIAGIDRAILAHLRRNGRMSCVELAKDIGASEKTIRTHMKKMEENGIIRGYTIREGGVGLTALVRIKVLPGAEIGSFASEVTGWEGIEIIYEVSGDADLVALVHVDDTMALRALLDKMWMAAPNEIGSTTTELVLEQY